jgi:hypothetical protein
MQPTAASSACSDKRAHLAHRLKEALPLGARLALCFDPEGDLDGYDSIGADASRLWQILTYREDDLSFRLAVHELEAKGWNAGSPVLLFSCEWRCPRWSPSGTVSSSPSLVIS